MTKTELLQAFAKGWFGNSQQHSIHAQLLKQRGFGKLGEKAAPRDRVPAGAPQGVRDGRRAGRRRLNAQEYPRKRPPGALFRLRTAKNEKNRRAVYGLLPPVLL